MAGALAGLGAGLQGFAQTYLAAKQNQLERLRQQKMDAASLANDEATRRTQALQQQQIEANLNDLPSKRAGEDAQTLASALGAEGKFSNPAYLDLMKKAGTPLETREPLLPSAQMDWSKGQFGPQSTDDSVDATTHAVLPPDIIAGRAARDVALAKEKAIMGYLSGSAAGAEPGSGTGTVRDRVMAKLGLGIDPNQLYGNPDGAPLNVIDGIGAKGGANEGQPVKEGVDRKGEVKWEKPQADNSVDVGPQVQQTATGHKYLNLGAYSGTAEHNSARKAAEKAGIITVNPDQADSLQAVDNARRNQADIIAQVKGLLPKDTAGRITGFAGVPLAQFFQTNAQQAAFKSWRTSAIQTLRAAAGSKGLRINQAEILLAVANDLPELNDKADTALQKVANINSQLDNVENSILGNRASGGETTNTTTTPLQAQMPGGAKTASAAEVTAYARARNLSPVDAANQLKANGYTITGR